MIRRRLLHGLLLLALASILAFAFAAVTPGDYFEELRLDPRVSPELIEGLRARYGLDAPWYQRYGRWLGAVVRGDLGTSFRYGTPVLDLVSRRAVNTLLLTVPALALSWLLAIPLGAWVAARGARHWVVTGFSAMTSLLLALPEVVLALGLLLLAASCRSLPVGGMQSLDFADLSATGKVGDLLRHLLLPLVALVLVTLPQLLRHVHAGIDEVLRSDLSRSLKSRGLGRRSLIFRHALSLASNPLLSLFGLSVASLLSASLLIEVVFSWPGLGPLFLEAIQARDVDVVAATVLLSTVLLVLGNLIADLLLYASDPRVRSERTTA